MLLCTVARAQFTGGSFNGSYSHLAGGINLLIPDSLYHGGNGQGFSTNTINHAILFKTDSLFSGGDYSGFNASEPVNVTLYKTDSIYQGGAGRGENFEYVPLVNLDVGCNVAYSYWNGGANTFWNNAANWECGNVPGINSSVIIPGAMPRYPILLSSQEIKSLELRPGANISLVNGATLKLNGQ